MQVINLPVESVANVLKDVHIAAFCNRGWVGTLRYLWSEPEAGDVGLACFSLCYVPLWSSLQQDSRSLQNGTCRRRFQPCTNRDHIFLSSPSSVALSLYREHNLQDSERQPKAKSGSGWNPNVWIFQGSWSCLNVTIETLPAKYYLCANEEYSTIGRIDLGSLSCCWKPLSIPHDLLAQSTVRLIGNWLERPRDTGVLAMATALNALGPNLCLFNHCNAIPVSSYLDLHYKNAIQQERLDWN